MVSSTIRSGYLIRVAFPLIGGRQWMGGYNYILNLLRILGERAADRIAPFLFIGTALIDDLLGPLLELPHLVVVRHADFDQESKSRRLARAVLTGRDNVALDHFRKAGIQVVFEHAQFYGWRFPLPAVAWTPDFTHRHSKHLLGVAEYWKRELGFRAQILSKRRIMVSSEDARRDCESFYPASRGFTDVVRFAVQPRLFDSRAARAIADSYGLPNQFFFVPNQFWRHKNHECVIRALHILRERGKSVVIAVTGKQADLHNPDHFPRLMEMVETWHLEDEFRLLGLVPSEHLFALMHCCSALINPSFFEGWSTTVEEAKSIGVPMLLSSLEVHKEQAEGRATFFHPHSPEELATALSGFRPLSNDERQDAFHKAAIDAERRVGRFADEFCTLVERAANKLTIGVNQESHVNKP
jgi:glycosyltransferase involved in cell wall biosynthesis